MGVWIRNLSVLELQEPAGSPSTESRDLRIFFFFNEIENDHKCEQENAIHPLSSPTRLSLVKVRTLFK